MEKKRNLCAMIPESLHAEVRREQEQLGQTLGEYIEQILTEHFNRKGGTNMSGTHRTLAFQIPEELFLELKAYLEKHHLKQKDFMIGLIRQALAEDASDEN